MPAALTQYIPMAIPFAILTVVGGINVTESARLAGDDYRTRDILLTEAIATLIAGVCGGVSQSTPYIGHPAYKAMGGRAAYTLACALFVGLGGMLGYIPLMAKILPLACLAPILIFVAYDIVAQSFHATPPSHAAAVCFAIFPSIAQLLRITLDKASPERAPAALRPGSHMVAETAKIPLGFADNFGVFLMLAHGFILTAMLWGAFLAFLIDHRFVAVLGDPGHLLRAVLVRRDPFGLADGRHLPALEPVPAGLGGAVPLGRRLCVVAIMIAALGASARRSADARGDLAA
jgi:AGZA family xanthine/uracil permease-like MFS transporter